MPPTRTTISVPAELIELLADHSLTVQELARACRMNPEWVHARVYEGLLGITQTHADPHVQAEDQGSWRFSCSMVLRARRIADLERQFDADPQLAALAVDLMEEVAVLRSRLEDLA